MEKIGGCFLGWVFNINYDHIGGRYTNYVHNVINILGVLFKFEGGGKSRSLYGWPGQNCQSVFKNVKLLNESVFK